MAGKGTRLSARRAWIRRRQSDWAPSAENAEREIRRTRKVRYRRHRQNVFMFIVALSLALGYLVYSQGFMLVKIEGTGMSPTLQSGAMVLCFRQTTLDKLAGIIPEDMRRVGRNDLVLINYNVPPDGETYRRMRSAMLVKRVIGLGGDQIDTGGDEIIVNREETAGRLIYSDLVYPVVVPTGRMYALGDNRSLSVDSRQRSFGMVAEADVIARPVLVVWPVYAMGLVE